MPEHALVAAVTRALRALPFAALARLRAGATVRHLGTRMPADVMVILVVALLGSLAGPAVHVTLAGTLVTG
ncbi:hypothetical protein ACF08O_00375 [Streptomyces paradoxus]|uniref:hypothetical protein n=1 Tax=Streptomyces paradoxus TaxID=66375 RepID=UPI0036FDA8E9